MDNLYKQECQEKLGDEYGAIVGELVSSWAWGRVKSDEYWRLFSKADDLEFLNAITGGRLLWHIQQILWDDLILHVARLTDPCDTGGKKKLDHSVDT